MKLTLLFLTLSIFSTSLAIPAQNGNKGTTNHTTEGPTTSRLTTENPTSMTANFTTPTTTTTTAAPITTVPKPSGPVITTTGGKVEGHENGAMLEFLGIPYAKAKRFEKPSDPAKWNTTRKAVEFGKSCPQLPDFLFPIVNQSEDCLFLNVYTAAKIPTNATKLMPVMVFIHGGGFVSGSSSFYPASSMGNFVKRGVIVVTINYRLNVFGFFTTNTSECPGNLGLHDQIFALKWVQKNIKNFGGNPKKVTIFGESAGGASVSLLTYSPLAKGLFSKAIMQSGTAMDPWGFDWWGEMKETSRKFAENATCLSKGGKAVNLTCLAGKSMKELLDLTKKTEWRPVTDGEKGVLPDNPWALRKKRTNIPVIIGTNRNEGAGAMIFELMNNHSYIRYINEKRFLNLLYDVAPDSKFGNQSESVRELLYLVYTVKYVKSKSALEWFRACDHLLGGFGQYAGALQEVDVWKEGSNNSKVYLYSFDFISATYPWPNITGTIYSGVMHGMDLAFLFDTLFQTLKGVPKWPFGKEENAVSNNIINYWTTFAKTGNPNAPPRKGSPPPPMKWTPTKLATRDYLSILVTPAMQKYYHFASADLWNKLIPALMRGEEPPPPTRPPPTPSPNLGVDQGYQIATFILLGILVILMVVFIYGIVRSRRNAGYSPF